MPSSAAATSPPWPPPTTPDRHASLRSAGGVAPEEVRLGDGQPLDLYGMDALVGCVDQAQRLLDADQHDLGGGVRLLQDAAQRDRAALTRGHDVHAVRLAHGRTHRAIGRTIGGREEAGAPALDL